MTVALQSYWDMHFNKMCFAFNLRLSHIFRTHFDWNKSWFKVGIWEYNWNLERKLLLYNLKSLLWLKNKSVTKYIDVLFRNQLLMFICNLSNKSEMNYATIHIFFPNRFKWAFTVAMIQRTAMPCKISNNIPHVLHDCSSSVLKF